MNLKHTFILSLFFLLTLSAVKAALIQTLDESRVIEVPISKEDLTRITVQEDRIRNVFGVTGEYVLETDEDQGQVFIRLPNSSEISLKPISLTLTTEKGRTQDLRLIPKDQAAEALILKPLEENQKACPPTYSGAGSRAIDPRKKCHLISRGDVENLLEACRAGRIPLGYKEAPLNLYAPQGPYKLIRELKGDTLRCLTYEVKNSLQSSAVSDKKPILNLSEPLFTQSLPLQKQNLVAILIPHHILRLGEHTHVYVVARTD